MDFIEINAPNWRTYNPRSDRTPSWFRLQNDFFLDPKLWHLDDATRCLLLFLFCEVSKNRGRPIKLSLEYISAQRGGLSKSKISDGIRELVKLGVIETPNGNQAVTKSLPNGSTTNERTNERTSCPTGVGRHRLAEIWNGATKSLPKVKSWNKSRAAAVRRLEVEESDWKKACSLVEGSDFLSGRSGKWTLCSFDWLVKPANLTKVLEGNYENRETKSKDSFSGVADV